MNSKTIISLTLLLLFMTIKTNAQDNQKPCSDPKAAEFDFWVGEWDLTWADSGKGTNIITKELGGCVIEENFRTIDDSPFIGNSLSVYDVKSGIWKQTWVDNNGAYLDFTGGKAADSMILSRTAVNNEGKEFKQRMVFYDIKEDSLEWKWEASRDDGKTWKVLWAIHYKRKM